MRVLVTGGAGFIGSITTVQLIQAGHQPVLLDNFVNSKPGVLDRIAQLSGSRPLLVLGDVRDGGLLDALLGDHGIEAVIHFAGLKAVGESAQLPLGYYDNNVHGSLALLQAMHRRCVRTLVFSSSATVYDAGAVMPLAEDAATCSTSPYGRSKLMVEQIMADLAAAEPAWSLTALRYFNPAGAHESGCMGEDPQGVPNNLMPYIAQVAGGRRDKVRIFGKDYSTPDGTGVRDYVHVLDLAQGHLAALTYGHRRPGLHTFNLGTGRGHSVLEVVAAFARACGRELPCEFAPRRHGDVAAMWADPARSRRELGWQATRSLDQMCQDAWRWQRTNPLGYDDSPLAEQAAR